MESKQVVLLFFDHLLDLFSASLIREMDVSNRASFCVLLMNASRKERSIYFTSVHCNHVLPSSLSQFVKVCFHWVFPKKQVLESFTRIDEMACEYLRHVDDGPSEGTNILNVLTSLLWSLLHQIVQEFYTVIVIPSSCGVLILIFSTHNSISPKPIYRDHYIPHGSCAKSHVLCKHTFEKIQFLRSVWKRVQSDIRSI